MLIFGIQIYVWIQTKKNEVAKCSSLNKEWATERFTEKTLLYMGTNKQLWERNRKRNDLSFTLWIDWLDSIMDDETQNIFQSWVKPKARSKFDEVDGQSINANLEKDPLWICWSQVWKFQGMEGGKQKEMNSYVQIPLPVAEGNGGDGGCASTTAAETLAFRHQWAYNVDR